MGFKRSVWGFSLLLAAAAAPVSAAGLAPALRLLAELPPATLEPGGEMREAATSRLLVLFSDEPAAAEAVCGRLRRALVGSYGRPYAAAAELDGALGLLGELLQAVPPLPLPQEGSAAPAAPAPQPLPLQQALVAE
ncbi:hypothetical protein HYH02_001708 [Chlamydomonas schloesseri]|uniref:Uncharacterized protein n=1 Tax=Chlamydomonas schloesseri TaxID=2026947 RepID=A0A836BBD8_9CHLO|nr:hypothetical protein HYH02_001708 [Chlamydomonas schloesseri]|eukprot:KAG2453487.1 hypothetical protein HYH02_001708 [Chlamydomonas schloesseri]